MQSSFLQSEEWAEIQTRDGHKAHRLQFGEEECFLYRHPLPLGFHYYYAPRIQAQNQQIFFAAIEKFSKLTKPIFIRIEPETELRIKNQELRIKNPAFAKATAGRQEFRINAAPNLQPQKTILIDLAKTDEELLAAMHPKTRYNVKTAERHGVIIEERIGSDAINSFFNLLQKTSDRDQFRLHPKSHYDNLLNSNSHQFSNKIYFAMYNNAPVAAAIINLYNGGATYLHGASDYQYRSLMAPFLLHFRIMQIARQNGAKTYDFWGIDETKWPGVTRFKKGFGGYIKEYPKSLDIVLSPIWYRAYIFIRQFRRQTLI